MRLKFFFFFFVVFAPLVSNAERMTVKILLPSAEEVTIVADDSTVVTHHTAKELRRQKLVTSMLAFPFPFGFIGAHRVMLGCKPWVPVVYVATFGGCFGLLPLIDFCEILFSKDLHEYENNPHIIMWVK